MSKEEKVRHVVISWANDFIDDEVTMATLQEISRGVEKGYTERTGKPLQITTILKSPKEKK